MIGEYRTVNAICFELNGSAATPCTHLLLSGGTGGGGGWLQKKKDSTLPFVFLIKSFQLSSEKQKRESCFIFQSNFQ